MRINTSDAAIQNVPEGSEAGNIVPHGGQTGIFRDALPPEIQSTLKTIEPFIQMLFGTLFSQDKAPPVKGYPAAAEPSAETSKEVKKKQTPEGAKTKAPTSKPEPKSKPLVNEKPRTTNRDEPVKADAPKETSAPSGCVAPAPAPNGTGSEPVAHKPTLDSVSQRELDRANSDRDFLSRFENGEFDLIESRYGDLLGWGKGDAKLSRGDLEWAAKDNSLSASARDLANQILKDPRLFNLMDSNSDGLITRVEIQALRETTEAKIEKLEGTSSTAMGATGGTGGTDGSQAPAGATGGDRSVSGGSATDGLPPTTMTGMPGAMDRVSKGIDAIMQEIADLPNQGLSEAKMNTASALLNQRLQALINLQQNMMTMVSNLSKMYAEISSNAIRNMK